MTARLQHRGYTVIAPANPTPRTRERRRLRGEQAEADPGPDRARCPFIRRCGDLRGRHPGLERQGPRVPRRAGARGGREQTPTLLSASPTLGSSPRCDRSRPPQADGTEGTEFIIDPAAFHSLLAADLPRPRRCRHGKRPTCVGAGRRPRRSRPRRRGRRSRRGTWSGARTRFSPRRRSGSWPSAPTLTRSRSTRPTPPTSRTRQRSPTHPPRRANSRLITSRRPPRGRRQPRPVTNAASGDCLMHREGPPGTRYERLRARPAPASSSR